MMSSIFKNWNWSKYDKDNPDHRRRLTTQLKYFLAVPDVHPNPMFKDTPEFSADRKVHFDKVARLKAQLQGFTTAADFPGSILPTIQKFQEVENYDDGWEMCYDVRDMSSQRRNGFSMSNIQSGITFNLTPTGQKAKLYQMSGDREFVWFDRYSGGLNWDRTLFDDEEWLTIEDQAIHFRNEAFRSRAAVYYALIEALPAAQNVAWQAPTPAALAVTDRAYQAVRDANTINLAAQQIILATQNSGYGVTPTASFILLVPLQLRGRLKRALDIGLDNVSGSVRHVDYNFQMVVTTMLATTNVYYVILPNRKMKVGLRMDLTSFTDFDMLSYSDSQVGWMRHGGAIGDVEQLRRCALA
jgi:hypothetical protein